MGTIGNLNLQIANLKAKKEKIESDIRQLRETRERLRLKSLPADVRALCRWNDPSEDKLPAKQILMLIRWKVWAYKDGIIVRTKLGESVVATYGGGKGSD
jgi:hypothetical protein